jgi:hypothetical protein
MESLAQPRARVVILLAVAHGSLAACSKAKPNPDFWKTLPQASPAAYEPGSQTIVAQATIDAAGGTLSGPAGTPVEGITVTVPAGALSESTTLGLGYDDGSFTNVSAEEQNVVMVLTSSGAHEFDQPLTISFPFTDSTLIPVAFYIDDSGGLEVVNTLPVDWTAGQGSFMTWHASDYTWLNVDPASPKPVNNGFDVSGDGFPIDNTVPVKYAPDGRCLGMINFAKWYKEKAGGSLGLEFLDPIPTATSGAKLSGQQLIATRAHNSVSFYNDEVTATDDLTFITTVKEALAEGAVGVPVGIATDKGSHALLAIGYSDNQIALYDPNHPGVTKAMDYTLSPAHVSYGDWKYFVIFGGEHRRHESFDHILQDAQAGFHGENETKIEITSHSDGQKVSSTDVSLEGHIHSGQVLISELEAKVTYDDGSESAPVTLPMPIDDDSFRLPLTLKKGTNVISFVTRGYVALQGVQEISHDPETFTLDEDDNAAPASLITITSSRTVTNSDGSHSQVSVSMSANLVYFSYPSQIVNPAFDFTQCDTENSICDLISGYTLDSTDILSANLLPVSIQYRSDSYDKNGEHDGYREGSGTLSCNGVHFRVFVEPGSTAASHRYRFVAEPTGLCPAGATPMLSGQDKDPLTGEWSDVTPEPLTVYRDFPGSLRVDGTDVLPCESPAQIMSADMDSWVSTQASQKSWTLTSGLDSCVQYDDSTVSEDTTVSLTLVP